MNNLNVIDKSVQRKESYDKVTGMAKYTNDYEASLKAPGVRAVLTGSYFPRLIGSTILDRPPIAIDKVRYNGERVVQPMM